MKIKELMSAKLRSLMTNYNTAQNRFDEILRTKMGVGETSKIKEALMHYKNTKRPRGVNRADVTMPGGATAADLDRVFAGTSMQGLGEAFVKAEKKSGVNAWFLAAVATLESGYGTSEIAKDKNNLFGFCAYDDSPYSSAKKFATKEKGIEYVADFLSREYLSDDGAYFKGRSVDAVGQTYATDKGWADKVYALMVELSEKAGASAGSSSE
ncbi:MAG: glucosaminidase domain-containing protein [Bacillota bacterium]|nr:glucosaminidase domain-containing protein [Bacillota bacterium]